MWTVGHEGCNTNQRDKTPFFCFEANVTEDFKVNFLFLTKTKENNSISPEAKKKACSQNKWHFTVSMQLQWHDYLVFTGWNFLVSDIYNHRYKETDNILKYSMSHVCHVYSVYT